MLRFFYVFSLWFPLPINAVPPQSISKDHIQSFFFSILIPQQLSFGLIHTWTENSLLNLFFIKMTFSTKFAKIITVCCPNLVWLQYSWNPIFREVSLYAVKLSINRSNWQTLYETTGYCFKKVYSAFYVVFLYKGIYNAGNWKTG